MVLSVQYLIGSFYYYAMPIISCYYFSNNYCYATTPLLDTTVQYNRYYVILYTFHAHLTGNQGVEDKVDIL